YTPILHALQYPPPHPPPHAGEGTRGDAADRWPALPSMPQLWAGHNASQALLRAEVTGESFTKPLPREGADGCEENGSGDAPDDPQKMIQGEVQCVTGNCSLQSD